MLKNGSKASDLENVKEILGSNGLDVSNVNIAVFVGTVPDPLKGKTPWGERPAHDKEVSLGIVTANLRYEEDKSPPGPLLSHF